MTNKSDSQKNCGDFIMIHRYLVFTVCCFKTRNFEISKQNIIKWKAFEKPLLIELRREKSVVDVRE